MSMASVAATLVSAIVTSCAGWRKVSQIWRVASSVTAGGNPSLVDNGASTGEAPISSTGAAMYRPLILLASLTSLAIPQALQGQRLRTPQVFLTVFRNPSSGIELRFGQVGVHAGYYPTILKADGEAKGKNTNFLRVGGTIYSSATGTALYLSPSIAVSLDRRFKSGVFTDAGIRGRIGGPVAGRLGVGMLNTFDGELRVNPTVGLDIRLGKVR
jgi:hypothetical protein